MPVQFIKSLDSYRAIKESRMSHLVLISFTGKPGDEVDAPYSIMYCDLHQV